MKFKRASSQIPTVQISNLFWMIDTVLVSPPLQLSNLIEKTMKVHDEETEPDFTVTSHSISRVASVALAGERPHGIYASSILVTVVHVCSALINI